MHRTLCSSQLHSLAHVCWDFLCFQQPGNFFFPKSPFCIGFPIFYLASLLEQFFSSFLKIVPRNPGFFSFHRGCSRYSGQSHVIFFLTSCFFSNSRVFFFPPRDSNTYSFFSLHSPTYFSSTIAVSFSVNLLVAVSPIIYLSSNPTRLLLYQDQNFRLFKTPPQR